MDGRTTSLVDAFVANATAAGFQVHSDVPEELRGAATSTALHAVAATGSVVLAAGPDEPRARSLLEDPHVTLVFESSILPDLESLFAALGRDLPSALAIVTGPSRSGDIEQRLVVGVHGPANVHVVVLPDVAPSARGRSASDSRAG